MWNSFRTDALDGLTAEVITYPGGGGDEIHAYVAQPTSDQPLPGIVAVHHLPGWDEFYREFSDRLARHGYRRDLPRPVLPLRPRHPGRRDGRRSGRKAALSTTTW